MMKPIGRGRRTKVINARRSGYTQHNKTVYRHNGKSPGNENTQFFGRPHK